MKLVPLADKIIVRRMEAEGKSPGGIVIPDSAKEKPQRGLVVAVGPGKILDNGSCYAIDVREGDTILFSKYSGHETSLDGKDLLIISQDDVLATIEE